MSGPPRLLETKRLRLEATSSEHADDLWSAVRESSKELALWMPWAINASFADTLAFAVSSQGAWDKAAGWNFTVLLEGEVIGSVGLDHHEPLIGASHIGYWIRSDRAGRGLMTEAASAIVGFGFERLGLHRIELLAAIDNRASARIAEKLGFTQEGVLRHAGRGIGGWQDMRAFGLLEDDPRDTYH